MKYQLTKLFRSFVGNIIIALLATIILDLLIWFFLGVIFQVKLPHILSLVQWIYISSFGILMGFDGSGIIAGMIVCLWQSNRLKVPYNDMVDAIVRYQLKKEKPLKEWDKEWVISRLNSRGLAEGLARTIIESVFVHRRR